MLSYQQRFDAFQAAMNEERRLFEKVKGMLPNTPNYHDAWNEWLQAMNRTNAASRALRDSSPELLNATCPSGQDPG